MLESIKKAVELTHEYEKQTIELNKQAQTTRLSIQREELSLQSQINDKQKEYTTLVIQNQINAIQRQQRVNELAAERIDILRKGREEEAKSQMSGVLAPLFTEKNKSAIEIKFKEEELNDLKKALGAQVASAAAILKKEEELALTTKGFDDQKLEIQKQLNSNDIATRTLEIDSRIKEAERQRELFKSQSEAIQEQVKAFLEHPKELSKVLSQNILDQLEIAKRNNPDRAAEYEKLGKTIQERQTTLDTKIVSQVEDINKRLTESASSVAVAQQNYATALQEQKAALTTTADGQQRLIDLEKAISEARSNEAVTAAQAKYNSVVMETGNKLLAATQSLEILKREAERANNSFIVLAVKTAEAITSNFEKSMNSLVDAIASGTLTLQSFRQGFKQFIVNILSDITKALVTETITKPFKEMVFGFTKDLIGAGGDVTKGLTESASKAITTSLGENITKSVDTLKNAGITAVYVTNVAEFCACSSGGAAAGAAGGATEAATKAAAEVGAKTGTDAAVQAAADIPLPPVKPSDLYASPATASAAYTAPGVTYGTATITTGMGPAGFESTFGQRGAYAGNGLYNTADYNTLTNTYSRGSTAAPLSDLSMGYQQPIQGVAFGNSGTQAPGFGANMIDSTVVKDATDNIKELSNNTKGLTGSFGDLSGVQEAFKGKLNGAGSNVEQLGNSSSNAVAGQDALANSAASGSTALATHEAAVAGSAVATEGEAVAKGVNTAATTTNTAAETLNTSATVANAGAKGAEGGGGFFSSIFSAITGFFGKASGGMVGGTAGWNRFAGGGLKMRDSVPSLLEPGEFVMKKSSVDSIGRSAMERMNATGKASGATNIKVQVENQGQPKEAEQGQTQMDGETAIVKLILKDLNSNGPIRRSIRGNM
jgi:hypothetical protein